MDRLRDDSGRTNVRVVLAVVAIVCAVASLAGVDLGVDVDLTALGLLFAGIALVV